jgi:HK97 family phage prohead protease
MIMKTVRKQFIAETKVDDDERTVTAVISTDLVDRDNEVMLPKGGNFEQFLKNPVVPWAHSYHEPPIGKAEWLTRGRKQINAKVQFADTAFAEEIFQLFKGGYLNAFSIGFIPKNSHAPTPDEIKKKPEWAEARRIIDEWELLEFSAVPVPANPEALATAVKSKSVSVSKELQEQLGIEEEDEEVFYPASAMNTGDTDNKFVFTEAEMLKEEEVLKPYPNEHACRLKQPDYDRYARKKCEQKHDGKCIDVIYGIKGGKSEIQALRYPKDIWTAAAARSHCSDRGGSFEPAKEAGVKPKSNVKKKHDVVVKKEKPKPDYNGKIKKSIGRKLGKIYS